MKKFNMNPFSLYLELFRFLFKFFQRKKNPQTSIRIRKEEILQLESYIFTLKPLDKLYSLQHQQWFMIQHLPSIITAHKKLSRLEILTAFGDDYLLEETFFCFWVCTEKYNTDLGVKGNIPIPANQIGHTFLTEDQYKPIERDKILTALLN